MLRIYANEVCVHKMYNACLLISSAAVTDEHSACALLLGRTSSETLYAPSPCRGKKSTKRRHCVTSAPLKRACVFLLKVCWEAFEAAWKEAAEIKEKMKGQKAQRNGYGKCCKRREKDQGEYENCRNNHNSIRTLGRME